MLYQDEHKHEHQGCSAPSSACPALCCQAIAAYQRQPSTGPLIDSRKPWSESNAWGQRPPNERQSTHTQLQCALTTCLILLGACRSRRSSPLLESACWQSQSLLCVQHQRIENLKSCTSIYRQRIKPLYGCQHPLSGLIVLHNALERPLRQALSASAGRRVHHRSGRLLLSRSLAQVARDV